jgi:predicted S18 family serine protease
MRDEEYWLQVRRREEHAEEEAELEYQEECAYKEHMGELAMNAIAKIEERIAKYKAKIEAAQPKIINGETWTSDVDDSDFYIKMAEAEDILKILKGETT